MSKFKKSLFIKKYFLLSLIIFVFVFCGLVMVAHAQGLDLGLQYAAQTGLTTTDIRITVARIIRVGLGLLGIVAVGMILYAGLMWMLAKGEEKQVETAKKIIINAAIGLAIVLSAFAITQFILNSLTNATVIGTGAGQGPGGTSGQQIGGSGLGGGALGKILSSHYPARDATNVPRNTKVVITFVEKIKDDTVFVAGTQPGQKKLNSDNIKIYKSLDAGQNNSFPIDAGKLITDVNVATNDSLTYVFSFPQFLGSPSQNIKYTVFLTNGIKKADGSSVFTQFENSYAWQFETGITIDVTPPQVESVSPINQFGCVTGCFPRNKIIQINFNEPVDPTTVSGTTPGFTNILIYNPAFQNVPGVFTVSNQYRTVTFMPSTLCEGIKENSCGEKVYCLAADTLYEGKIEAADVDATVGGPQALLPYTGVVDLAGNSLDSTGALGGGPDGKAEGADIDSYYWKFATNNNIDLEPPKVISITPSLSQSSVDLNQNIEVVFSKPLSGASLFNSLEVQYTYSTDLQTKYPWAGAQVIGFGQDQNNKIDNKILLWQHFDSLESSTKTKRVDYYPLIKGTLKDDTQNCFVAEGPTALDKSSQCERRYQDAYLKNEWQGAVGSTYPVCDLQNK